MVEFYYKYTVVTVIKQALLECKSIFVPALLASFDNSTHFYIITDFVPGGDLFLHLREKESQRFSAKEVKFFAVQLVMAVEYLHAHNVIYRNLIPENIMLTSNGYIKLIDFSCSKVKN